MRMLDLFSGIGGFSLAAQQVWGDKLDIAGFCEIDEYCCKILRKNFPNVPVFNDIKELDGKKFDDIFLMTGGFPCQDISIAGKGKGIEGKRSGLWSEMHRLISEVRPRYALIENVPMLVHRGLKRVLCDLAEVGYDAEWQIISAKHVGAPHLRYRIWIVAYPQYTDTDNAGSHREKVIVKGEVELQDEQIGYTRQVRKTISKEDAVRNALSGGFGRGSRWWNGEKPENGHMGMEEEDVSNSNSRLRRRRGTIKESGANEIWGFYPTQEEQTGQHIRSKAIGCDAISEQAKSWWQTQSSFCGVPDGISYELDKGRTNRIKSLGNAIVPQIAFEIGKAILAAEDDKEHSIQGKEY